MFGESIENVLEGEYSEDLGGTWEFLVSSCIVFDDDPYCSPGSNLVILDLFEC